MANKMLLAIAVLVFVVLSCCALARPAVPSPLPLPLPAGKWAAKLAQSGGLIGVRLTVEISSDGKLGPKISLWGAASPRRCCRKPWMSSGA